MTVSSQQREAYTAIIDEIVAASDLNTVSVNQIREGLQDRVDHDLAPQKVWHTRLGIGQISTARR
jgi:upstream activation factor subunit UAF30